MGGNLGRAPDYTKHRGQGWPQERTTSEAFLGARPRLSGHPGTALGQSPAPRPGLESAALTLGLPRSPLTSR